MIVIIFSFYDIYIYIYKFILRILEMIIIHYNILIINI